MCDAIGCVGTRRCDVPLWLRAAKVACEFEGRSRIRRVRSHRACVEAIEMNRKSPPASRSRENVVLADLSTLPETGGVPRHGVAEGLRIDAGLWCEVNVALRHRAFLACR